MLVSELTIYDFLKDKIKLPDAEAKRYAKEIAQVEEKLHEEIKTEVAGIFEKERNLLSTKEDINRIEQQILKLEVRMEAGFRDNLKWIVGLLLAAIGLAVTIIKAF